MQEGWRHHAFMQDASHESEEVPVAEQLRRIVDEMLAPYGKKGSSFTTLFAHGAPFDYSKPNQHDSKAEFIREKSTIEKSIEGIDKIIDALLPPQDYEHRDELLNVVWSRLDQKLREAGRQLPVRDPIDLIRQNVGDVDGTVCYVLISLDFKRILHDRLSELEEQEARFWNLKHRAPDYYAREIALRLARVYARETGKRPTVGTSGMTGDPSTSYTRALADVFSVLSITSNLRSPAEWAVRQITEEDLAPKPAGPTFGAIFGKRPPVPQTPTERLVSALAAKKSQE